MPDGATIEKTKEKQDTDKDKDRQDEQEPEEPDQYKVILLNDDFTPFDFVIDLLMSLFRKGEGKATQITMQVHREGQGVAGVYSKEIAETKKQQAVQRARSEGHPLELTIEKDE